MPLLLTNIHGSDSILYELVGVSIDPQEVNAAEQSVRQS